MMLLELLHAPIQPTAGAGLSGDAKAAITGAVVGGVLGMLAAVIGQYVQRRLRMKGKVQCRVRSFMVNFLGPNVVRFSFPIYLYNDKDVDIGITDILLTVWHRREHLVSTPVIDSESGEAILYLDLPSCKWVRRRAMIEVPMPDARVRQVRELYLAELSWIYPAGRRVTRVISKSAYYDKWYKRWWYTLTDSFRRRPSTLAPSENPYGPLE